ncbi:carbohydrate ABC transporter permease [Jeotgalibaca caeni]|uniref:carbohydrate ABC transporter permease n=1 Tax=Jeotgalibaca caeni TaxID=3028623 RepID=UPI00237EC773|nr:carbohydrate ABC transporter permease [Jeotgalibaca caeni]MDE1549537.1 carbohydrate ABC transporter permease [Jeotgalibaca caeni]
MNNSSKIAETKRDKAFNVFIYIFLTVALLIVLYPLIYVISASISEPVAVNSGRMWLWPVDITFEGYKEIFSNRDIWQGYKMTIFYTVAGTLISLFITIPCAYAMARPDFYGKEIFTKFLLVTMFVSGGLIPGYLLIKSLGWINTVWAILIPGSASVYNIVVTRSFFQSSIPWEMQEAAIIDGASTFKIFTRVILPLSAPIIAVMTLYYGVGRWNSYFDALVYLSDKSLYPLQMVLRQILVLQDIQQSNVGVIDQNIVDAMTSKEQLASIIKYGVMIVSSIPVIVFYPFIQKYFAKGVMVGSLKG